MVNGKKILKLSFHGDPNIGLHGLATEKFCLLGTCVDEKDTKQIEKTLQVPVFQLNLYGTDLVGLFAVASSDTVLLPEIVFPGELDALKEKFGKINVSVSTIKTEHTALGNNILLNDKAGIISTVFDKKTAAQIKKIFPGIKFEQLDLAKTSVPGSVGKIAAKGGIFSPNITDTEIKNLESTFSFEIGLGTVNMGNPFVSSGIIANSNGIIVGSSSSGYEMSRIFESLGFS